MQMKTMNHKEHGSKANTQKLSLMSSVSLGTGVMIGAGIFVLMGQIA